MKPQSLDFRRGDRSQGGQHQYSFRLHQHAQIVKHTVGIRESFEIDDRKSRLDSRSQVPPHRWPGVRRDDVESRFNQLSANERARLPLCGEEDDVGRQRPHNERDQRARAASRPVVTSALARIISASTRPMFPGCASIAAIQTQTLDGKRRTNGRAR